MTKLNRENIIFDLTKKDHVYKGVLFAEMDHERVHKETQCPFPIEKDYVAGIMAIIWTDEKGIWHAKMRIKFPSGNKQVVSRSYEEEFKEEVHVNETFVLNDLYQMPMKNKSWHRNPTGDCEGILKIISETDMIESFQTYEQ